MGELPAWYRAIKAARYLGVPPWELAAQPLGWLAMAEAAQGADAHAEAMLNKHRQPQ